MKKFLRDTSLVFGLLIVFYFIFGGLMMSGFGIDHMLFKVYIISCSISSVLCFVGYKIMSDDLEHNTNKFALGAIIGLILPVTILIGYYSFHYYYSYQGCVKDARSAYCKEIMSKEKIDAWFPKNCLTINRTTYHIYKCDDSISVPDEFMSAYKADSKAASYLINSLHFPLNTTRECLKIGNKINKPISDGKICDGAEDKWIEFPAKWPKLPKEWTLIYFENSVTDKSFKFQFQKDDMIITCDHISEYCEKNWY